jgi:hypothetical protein
VSSLRINEKESFMKTFLRILLIAGSLMITVPAMAQLHVGLGITLGPPALRTETIVAAPSPAHVWVTGYYRWHPKRHTYVWVPGHWQKPPRPHQVWAAGHWEQRNHEWVYFEGRWKKDSRGRK